MTGGTILLPSADARTAFRDLRRRLEARRAGVVASVLLFLARGGAGLVGPVLLGVIVDTVLEGRPASAVTGPVVLLVLAGVAEGALATAGPIALAHVAEPTLADLREDVVERVLELPLDEVERAGVGDIVARVDGDVSAVAEGVRGAVPEVVTAGLTVGLTLLGMAALDWRLGLAALCAVPIQLHTLRWYLPRSNPLYARERAAVGDRSTQLLETVAGAGTVRALGLAAAQRGQVAARSMAAVDLSIAATWLRTRFFARLNLAEVVGMTAILATGFVLVDRGAVTVGTVTTAVLFFQRIFDPVNVLLALVDEAQAAGAALARLVGVTSIPAAPAAGRDAGSAEVDVAEVDYAYHSGHEVLHGIDLTVGEGQRVAVVGTSGAGKSTLAKLLAAIHEPTAGGVTVGSVPVVEARTVAGRLPVMLITQEVHVFAGTLRDDLRLAAPDATDADVDAALDRVGALGWARALPDGLRTIVGDGGHSLTPAQSQQLALARLVLADPAVAVLDEATAEAGSVGARELEAAAAAAVEGRTAVVVAHRLTQARTADRIVVLDHGRIVEDGTHEQLVAAGGRYAELWRAWSGQDPLGSGGRSASEVTR